MKPVWMTLQPKENFGPKAPLTTHAQTHYLSQLLQLIPKILLPPLNRIPYPHTSPTSKPNILPPLVRTPKTNVVVRHIHPTELRDCRAKGLCFRCDEKWNPSHCCSRKVLILLGDEYEEPDLEPEDHPPDEISALTVCTETIITGVPGVRLRCSNNLRKAKRKSYNSYVGVEVRIGL
ncbi:uncharacterized protein LOC131652267 [Vicia villosa]|uniref:uncharacterized protein LOC131630710 n=1 Tax=Vicia villosa TaxID=3911 RepID=UPI00273C21ED|nr:uncharacterized protein LOC131630710 [Vicia villosa]XP_058778062.1 uncharacterized protein LOC131652267 [Vicia villosa]